MGVTVFRAKPDRGKHLVLIWAKVFLGNVFLAAYRLWACQHHAIILSFSSLLSSPLKIIPPLLGLGWYLEETSRAGQANLR